MAREELTPIYTAIILFVILTHFLLFQPTAFATSGVTFQPGPLVFGQHEDSGYRERFSLAYSGGLYIGRSALDGLPRIVIDAPRGNDSGLIVRELDQGANRKTLLITAPPELARKTIRATLFLQEAREDLVLLEWTPAGWTVREPILLSVDANKVSLASGSLHQLAFTTKSLGLFWLVPRDQSALTQAMLERDTAQAEGRPGGTSIRGVLPLTGAFVVLLIGWVLSQWLHRHEKHKPVTE